MTGYSRRRFIAISAAFAMSPRVARAGARTATWRGTAMGAPAQMTLVGLPPGELSALQGRVEAEIDRLENIFSLFRPESALCRLNREGELGSPPAELLELLTLCASVHRATGGAFDPTVQPLWRLHAVAAAQGTVPDETELAEVRNLIGLQHVQFDLDRVRFDRPGVAMTFNGIAQGYAADRVAAVLRRAGLTNVLVDMGEIQARGTRADRLPWRVGIAAPGEKDPLGQVELSDRALATSSPAGTLLDASQGIGHIFDPRTARPGGAWRVVSISAQSAVIADGLSTAICLMTRQAATRALRSFPDARIEQLIA